MSNRKEREDLKKWAKEMGLPCLSEERLSMILRGPGRDFILNFLMKRCRSDACIEAMVGNLYLDRKVGPGSSERQKDGGKQDEIDRSVNDVLFADKRKRLQQIEDQCQSISKEIEKKRDVVQSTKISPFVEDFGKVLHLNNIFVERIHAAERMLLELRRSSLARCKVSGSLTDAEKEMRISDCESKMLELSKAAHRAFQLVILRHFYPPEAEHSIQYAAPLSAEDFNALVMKVIDCSDSIWQVQNFLRKEREGFLKSCGNLRRKLTDGEHFSISDKTDELVTKWSDKHIDLHDKNKKREKILEDTKLKLEKLVDQLESPAFSLVGVEGANCIIQKTKVEAMIKRCRLLARKCHNIENLFPNVSMDIVSPDTGLHLWGNQIDGVDGDIHSEVAGMEDERGRWVDALDTVEMMQEVSQALKKAWPKQKESFTSLQGLRKGNSQLAQTVLKTQECLKLTMPKELDDITMNLLESRQNDPDYRSALTSLSHASKLSNTVSVNESVISASLDTTRSSGNSSFSYSETQRFTHSQDIDSLVKKVQNLTLFST